MRWFPDHSFELITKESIPHSNFEVLFIFKVGKFRSNKFFGLCFSPAKFSNMPGRKSKRSDNDEYSLAVKEELGKLCNKYQEE